MPVLRDPARVVAHLRMRFSARHPRLGTDGLERRSTSLRPAIETAVTAHWFEFWQPDAVCAITFGAG
jgi:hypothetical protein